MDLATLAAPISPDSPCGPDLDGEGDTEYFRCVARIEGLLPATFFTRDDAGRPIPFDRSTIAFPAEFKQLEDLLDRTRDLRLLTLLARLAALNRDLDRLSGALAAIARLLEERWDDVHPQGDGSDYALRGAVLQALDDMPTLVLPLQHIPLATSRRHGPVTFRSIMTANGEIPAIDGETPPDRATIERALAETDLADLSAIRDRLRLTKAATDAIRDTTLARLGFDGAVSLDRLPALVGRILDSVEPIILSRDPAAAAFGSAPASPEEGVASAGGAGPAPAPARPAGAVRTTADARRFLLAAGAYLVRAEPSSPAEPLVRQAAALVGQSFVDVLRALLPNQADETKISIGGDRLFSLSFQQLANLAGPTGENAGEANSESAPEPEPEMRFESRPEVVAALQAVGAFYRSAEPSSPIPLLLDRAIGLMERDFLALLKDVLPSLFARND